MNKKVVHLTCELGEMQSFSIKLEMDERINESQNNKKNKKEKEKVK